MKCQIEQQTLRLRLQASEFEQLLREARLQTCSWFLDHFALSLELRLDPSAGPAWQGDPQSWQLILPAAAVQALAARLPCRDGLRFTLACPQYPERAMQLILDVDIRSERSRS